ncbi:uncharacterized protein LOC101239132 isoform X2 [Hydra vulgaris]|uniref:Uncharacterized protein LOC101239132 isoform X2 n=1 Tax=Hydra vulgaris TaxID=6087 RepID=A0ABM4BQB1_HYDVU
MDKKIIDDFERERDVLIKELDYQRELSKSNFLIFKQKIISTGELLAEFHRKCQELETQKKNTNELKLKLEICYAETGSLRIQLEKALQANEPLKKTLRRFENEKAQLESEVQQLKNVLKSKEAEIIELKKVSYSSQMVQDTLKKTKCETEKEHERDKKKVLNQAKLLDQLNKKLQELRAKSKEDVRFLRQLERENAKLKEKNILKNNNQTNSDSKKSSKKKSNRGKASRSSPSGVLSPSPSPPHSPSSVRHLKYRGKRKVIKKSKSPIPYDNKDLRSPTSSCATSSGSSTDSESEALDGFELQQLLEHTNKLMPDIYKTLYPVLSPIPASPNSKKKEQSGLTLALTSKDLNEATDFMKSINNVDGLSTDINNDRDSLKDVIVQNDQIKNECDSNVFTKKEGDDNSLNETDNNILDGADDNSLDGTDDKALNGTEGNALDGTNNNALVGTDGYMLNETHDNAMDGTNSNAFDGTYCNVLGQTDGYVLDENDDNALNGTDNNALSGIDNNALNRADDNALGRTDGYTFGGTDDNALDVADDNALDVADDNALGSTDGNTFGGTDDNALDVPDDNALDVADDNALDRTDCNALGGTDDNALNVANDNPLGGTDDNALDVADDNTLGGTDDNALYVADDNASGGTGDNALNGTDDNALDGTDDNALDGTDDNALDGSNGNALDRTDDNALDETDCNALDGTDDNDLNGADDNALDGTDDNALDGIDDNALDGAGDNALNRTDDNVIDRVDNNALNRIDDNVFDGTGDNALDGANGNASDRTYGNSLGGTDDTVLDGTGCYALDGTGDNALYGRDDSAFTKILDTINVKLRSFSPPISPIPPSPNRSLLTPLISPLSQSTHHPFHLLNPLLPRNSHFIPIISPLPQTPLPESVSPIPLSPTILSPPLIRSSALLQSENSSIFAPKPQLMQPVLKNIDDLNVEQSLSNIVKSKVECDSFVAKRALLLNETNVSRSKNTKTENSCKNFLSSTVFTKASITITSTTALVKSNFNRVPPDKKVVIKNNAESDTIVTCEKQSLKRKHLLNEENLCKKAKISKNDFTVKHISDTLKQSSEPLKQSSEPLKQSSEPLKQSSEPLKQSSEPLKQSSEPLKSSEGFDNVPQLLKTFSEKSINIQQLFAALSDKVNNSAASLSKAIVKLIVSCDEFLLPVILKLIQTNLCSECGEKPEKNCKICTPKNSRNFFETCNPISILTQVLTETEYNLLCILNELVKLPHMKKLYIFLQKRSRYAVFEGMGKRLSCEVLALCRLYAVVSRVSNKLDDLIYFLYILAYDKVPHTNFAMFFITCYSIWPSIIFQSNLISQNEDKRLEYHNVKLSPLSGAFQMIAFYEAALKEDVNSLKILEYLFSINVRVTIQFLKEYIFELFNLLCEHKFSFMVRNTDTRELNMCPYAHSTAKALVLVCTRIGWEWTYNTLILSTIIQYLIQGFAKKNIHLDNISILIRSIGFLCQYGYSCGYTNFNEISDFLVTILKTSQSIAASVSESVQVATVFALMDIIPSQSFKLMSLIEKWIEDTKDFPVPAYIKQNISRISKLIKKNK